MKKHLYITIAVLAASVGLVSAQPGSQFNISYNIAFPSGDLGDFITKTSWRGATLEWKGVINDKVTAGIEASWQTFYEELDFDTYDIELSNITLAGKQYRTVNNIPIYARFDYHGGVEGDNVRWFAGIGVGTMWSERINDMGLYRFIDDPWHFALAPRVGVEYYLNDWRAITIAAGYDYGFKTSQNTAMDYFRISVGLSFIN